MYRIIPLCAALGFLMANAEIYANFDLVGPFVPGTGYWSDVPYGDMEFGPGKITTTGSWDTKVGFQLLATPPVSGNAFTSSAAAAVGNLGADVVPGTFSGAGIAVTHGPFFTLAEGQTVVLSAFVKRINGSAGTGNVYLDLWGTSFQVFVPNTTSEWQFVYGTYTSPIQKDLVARAVVDGAVTPFDEFYVDDLAVTHVADFSPPILLSAPEPMTTSALVAAGLVGLGVSRRFLRR